MDAHNDRKVYKCDACKKEFLHCWSWHCHMSSHSGVFRFICSMCHKGFNVSSDYKRHLFVHGGERPLKCEFCEKRFSHSNILKRHVKTHHTERNLECSKCGKVFSLLKNFRVHKLTHKGEKHLKCDTCDMSFDKPSKLQRHLKVHVNKPMLCIICMKSFKTEKDLESHSLKHAEANSDKKDDNTSPIDTEMNVDIHCDRIKTENEVMSSLDAVVHDADKNNIKPFTTWSEFSSEIMNENQDGGVQ